MYPTPYILSSPTVIAPPALTNTRGDIPMNRFTTLLMVCSLALALAPISTQAQDGPTVMMSSAQCGQNPTGEVLRNERERTLPIAQELVNEGMILEYGLMAHMYGDEWNLVTVVIADDVAAVIAANAELSSRLNDLYPDDDTYITNCPRHRDVFYQGIGATDGGTRSDGDAIHISYWECDFTRLGEIAEQDREAIDVYQGLVDEGMLNFRASAAHTWGNEWNYIRVTTADDLPAVLAGLAEAGDRLTELSKHTVALGPACTAHKDNFYRQVMRTDDPEGD